MSYNTLHAHPPVPLVPINEIRKLSQELKRGGGVKTNTNRNSYMSNYSSGSRGSSKASGGLTGEMLLLIVSAITILVPMS
jgi:hypothetical protein